VTSVINDGLEHSRFVALIMTPDYFNSPRGWTDAEWHAALYNDPDGHKARVILILEADCVFPFFCDTLEPST
jgi:TIR domain